MEQQPSPVFWDDPAALQRHQPQLHQHPLKTDRLGPGEGTPIPVGLGSAPGSLAVSEDQSIFHYCEGNLNFSTAHSEDDEYFHKKKLSRDPMSHRIIEKRRRDRMNNCLADLSRLIPAEYLKKGRGRVEKTEIIEMAIKHMQFLQSRVNLAMAECGPDLRELRVAKCEQSPISERENCEQTSCAQESASSPRASPRASPPPSDAVVRPIVVEHYRLGYQECLSEAMHFLVEVEGYFADDQLCVRLISHLQKHGDKVVKGDRLNFPRTRQPGEASSSSGSSSSCGAPKTAPPQHSGWSGTDDMPSSRLSDGLCSSPQSHSSHAPPHPFPHPMAHPMAHPPPDHPEPHHQHHSYKFKNTIKQRFSEEHSGQKRRRVSRSPSPSQSPSQRPSSPLADVPIFVLHSKGAFYIPLTVSYKILEPYLDADFLSDGRSGSTASTLAAAPASAVLHPVTISVNFQQCVKAPPLPPAAAPPPAPAWTRNSGDSGLGLGFMPLPLSWGLCVEGERQ